MNIITSLLSRYRERRDRKFRERIDRVYFQMDEYGNRYMKGFFFAVKDENSGAPGIVCVNPTTTIEEAQKEVHEMRIKWGQSFDGTAPFYSEGYLSAKGTNNS